MRSKSKPLHCAHILTTNIVHARYCYKTLRWKNMLWYLAVLLIKVGVLASRLNEYIRDYEPLFYPYITLREKEETKVYFHAFHQDFHVILRRGSRTLAAQAKLIALGSNSTTIIPVTDVSRHMVKGYVREFTNSSVHGYIFDGIFAGFINTPQESYKVDRASDVLSSAVEYGSLIYRYSDINVSAAVCLPSEKCRPFRIKHAPKLNSSIPRQKRYLVGRTLAQTRFPSGKVCTLRIMIDHVYYQQHPSNTLASVIAEVASVMDQVDDIYMTTDFDNDGTPDSIGFRIVEFVVVTNKNQPSYHHHADKLENPGDFVELLTHYKTNDMCLFLGFTARDFNGVLGVAYLRNPNSLGGTCSPRKPNTEYYYNVGFITSVSHKRRLSSAVVELVAAHEIGHAFGSEHDPETEECSPNSGGGKFIMFPSAPNTHALNSHKFSLCTRKEVNDKFISLGTKCFVEESSVSNCGNGIVDSDDEECDCGDATNCAKMDPCCTPSAAGQNGCKYKTGVKCSAREDDCCSSDCKVISAAAKKQCNPEAECKQPSYCDGVSKDCPKIGDKPSNSDCRNGIGLCVKDKCILKACHEKNLVDCQPYGFQDACIISCLSEKTCLPTPALKMFGVQGSTLILPTGESCAEGAGKCNRGRCEMIAFTPGKMPDTNKSPMGPLNKIVPGGRKFTNSDHHEYDVTADYLPMFNGTDDVIRSGKMARNLPDYPNDGADGDEKQSKGANNFLILLIILLAVLIVPLIVVGIVGFAVVLFQSRSS